MSERPAWMDDPDAWVGMAVDIVLVTDESTHTGVIEAVTGLTVNDTVVSRDYPHIRLDDGRMIGGLDCWWTKRDE